MKKKLITGEAGFIGTPASIIRKFLSYIRSFPKLKYSQDGLFTIHSATFMSEERFIKAYQAGNSTKSWNNMRIDWRVHTILWAANQALSVEGDFVECGTNRGGFASAIISYLEFDKRGRTFFLLDTFKGIDYEILNESEKHKQLPQYSDCYEDVVKTFAPFKNVQIIRGTVPTILRLVPSQKIAFMSIDMNNILPEKSALDFFWPKLSVGGIIVLDDFAYAGFEEQNMGHIEWAKEHNTSILTLPTGQGIIIKTSDLK